MLLKSRARAPTVLSPAPGSPPSAGKGTTLPLERAQEDLTDLSVFDRSNLHRRTTWWRRAQTKNVRSRPLWPHARGRYLLLTWPAARQTRVQGTYSGELHLDAIDWDPSARRETISVDGETALLSSSFEAGAWVRGTSKPWP